jgi:hypothetical protein
MKARDYQCKTEMRKAEISTNDPIINCRESNYNIVCELFIFLSEGDSAFGIGYGNSIIIGQVYNVGQPIALLYLTLIHESGDKWLHGLCVLDYDLSNAICVVPSNAT